MLTVAFAGSPTVFILNAVVLEIPIREQSEERVSYGAEPRPASRDLIPSVTGSDGKPLLVSISNNNLKEKRSLSHRRKAVLHSNDTKNNYAGHMDNGC